LSPSVIKFQIIFTRALGNTRQSTIIFVYSRKWDETLLNWVICNQIFLKLNTKGKKIPDASILASCGNTEYASMLFLQQWNKRFPQMGLYDWRFVIGTNIAKKFNKYFINILLFLREDQKSSIESNSIPNKATLSTC